MYVLCHVCSSAYNLMSPLLFRDSSTIYKHLQEEYMVMLVLFFLLLSFNKRSGVIHILFYPGALLLHGNYN